MLDFRNFKFLLFASLIVTVSANPVFRDFVVHERRQSAPNGFASKGSAPANQMLNLRIALVQSDTGGLVKALYDVSTPDSPLYGKHLTKEQVIYCHLRLLIFFL